MTPAGAPTVFVIDDDAAMRAAIRGLLSRWLAVRVLRDGGEFPRSKRPDGPSALFWTLSLPGVSGLDFSASWLTRTSKFPSSSLPVMEIFR